MVFGEFPRVGVCDLPMRMADEMAEVRAPSGLPAISCGANRQPRPMAAPRRQGLALQGWLSPGGFRSVPIASMIRCQFLTMSLS